MSTTLSPDSRHSPAVETVVAVLRNADVDAQVFPGHYGEDIFVACGVGRDTAARALNNAGFEAELRSESVLFVEDAPGQLEGGDAE